MAQSETLERVASIVDALTPIGGMASGQPLRAEDWNTVVAAVLQLAQLTGAREQTAQDALSTRFAERDHAHVGQADAGWFDAATRDLLEQSTGGSASIRSDIASVRRELAEVRAANAELQATVRSLQLALDGIDDRDRARELDLGRLGVRVEDVRTLQAEVARVRSDFGSIGGKLDQTLGFRDQLVGAHGQVVDVSGLAGRVGALETLRDQNLTASDGTVVRYRDFEGRLAQLADRVDGLQGGAGGVVDTSALRDELLAATDDRVATATADLRSGVDGLRADVSAATTRGDAQAASLEALGSRVSSGESQLALLGGVSGRLDGFGVRLNAVEGQANDASVQLQALSATATRVTALETAVGGLGALDSRVGTVESALGQVQAEIPRITDVERRVGDLEPLQDRVGGLEGDVKRLDGDVRGGDDRLGGLEGRVAVVESTSSDNANRLTAIDTELSSTRRSLTDLSTNVLDVRGSVVRLGGNL